jgi:UDP-glucose 4-epimerase
MRILVTGGAGFIGSHIVEGLLESGHEVAVLDDLSSGRRENVPPGARFFECDLRDAERTRAVVREFRPDAVSHQAAQASVALSMREPRRDADVNLIGGLNLLEACTEAGANVGHVVFASTGGAIYGEVTEGRADESSPARPESPYAIHKFAFEQLLRVYRTTRGLRTSVLRYANVYGPRQDPHGEAGVVAIFFAAALSGTPIRVNARKSAGDPGCVRDYVYVADVARANLLALSDRIEHPMINVGSGEPTTTLELARKILSVTGREVAVESGPPRIGDLERSLLDPSLARHYLGPLTSLERGLEATGAYYTSRRA